MRFVGVAKLLVVPGSLRAGRPAWTRRAQGKKNPEWFSPPQKSASLTPKSFELRRGKVAFQVSRIEWRQIEKTPPIVRGRKDVNDCSCSIYADLTCNCSVILNFNIQRNQILMAAKP
jgi:hypothetical protein